MFFVVRSNDRFNFPLGLIKYIVIVNGGGGGGGGGLEGGGRQGRNHL